MTVSSPPPASVTPAMRQYFDAKARYRDAILFFRMGDFFEMFYEDALTAARALELTLTSRSKDAAGNAVPMCGIPFHAADGYITRLVKRGFRVAICDQIEDPKQAKGVVKRDVTRVVSPGTLTDASYLDAREPAFLLALAPSPGTGTGDRLGVALLDVSTGEFLAAEYTGAEGRQALNEELGVLRPREVIVAQGVEAVALLPEIARLGIAVTPLDEWAFGVDRATKTLCDQLRTSGLHAFGLDGHPAATCAAGALVEYLRDTQKVDLAHVRAIGWRERQDGLLIDPMTFRHLEILEGADGGRDGSLLSVIDRTQTVMGARRLRAWLMRPLTALERIQDRLDAVEEFAFKATERGRLRDTLRAVHDLERLIGRVAIGTAGPRDLVALRQSLATIPRVRLVLEPMAAPLVQSLVGELDDLADVRDALASALIEEPPALARDGGMIRDGVDADLDGLRDISRSGREHIAAMEEAERARTGISSLKIRYNRVFGYYIEISKTNLGRVPDDYHRKQTIAGGERFITPALKAYEDKVLGADEKILERELAIFSALLAQIGSFVPAKDAKLPIVDRIFARVGAADNIARGQSTFMVEMQETANILHASTSRSLVVLDEIGRGTSTFDGLSIAWAVAEYLATNPRARPKTLFATHYHELTDLADALPGVVNAHVSAREWKDDIIFLRKIVSGRSDRSYGIQVARLAGLPSAVITRAQEILSGLERDELSRGGRPTLSGDGGDPGTRQLGLFASTPEPSSPQQRQIAERLKALDVDETTPRQALELLAELKKLSDES